MQGAPAPDAAALPGGLCPAPAPAGPCGRPTVIVMHASVGSGHRSAANAIAQAFELLRGARVPVSAESPFCSEGAEAARIAADLVRDGGIAAAAGRAAGAEAGECVQVPPDLQVEVLDVLDFGRIRFDGDKTASLFTGATRPVYDLTWRFTLTGRILWGGGTVWSRVMFPAFTEHVREVRPCAVVCTHITAANVAVGARMVSGLEFPIVCVPTDYETEGLWPHREADLFCVATEAMAETLRPRKIPESNIQITGIPTRDDFRHAYDKSSIRQKWGLPQDKRVVLALAGAYLPRPYVHFRETLDQVLPYLHSFPSLHMVFVAGKDADYARRVRLRCDELGLSNVTVLDYVDEMAALMAASDLAICKPGGLTVTECLCAQVPMILLCKAYGQEKVNVQMLTALGAAMHITTARELADALRHIERHPETVQAMLTNGLFLRRPNAAEDVACATMRLAMQGRPLSAAPRRSHFVNFYWGRKPAHTR